MTAPAFSPTPCFALVNHRNGTANVESVTSTIRLLRGLPYHDTLLVDKSQWEAIVEYFAARHEWDRVTVAEWTDQQWDTPAMNRASVRYHAACKAVFPFPPPESSKDVTVNVTATGTHE